MSPERNHLDSLLNQPVLSEEERQWLLDYLNQTDTPELRQLILDRFADELLIAGGADNATIASEKMLDHIRLSMGLTTPSAKVIHFIKYRSVAAACFLLLAVAAFFFIERRPRQSAVPVTARVIRRDVPAPKTNRATITLSNGQQVVLDSSNEGTLAMQGDVRIEKAGDGSISYHGSALQNVYNTLFNPRGSKPVSLTLSDGTKVWLNSESSIRYPAAFGNTERNVEITGEAYFEVQKVPGSTFHVNVGGRGMIEVLGTHFNINSYNDEASTQVTLLEGNISLSLTGPNAAKQSIRPGQQASYSNEKKTNTIAVRNDVNVDAVMAWKNGYFNFDNASLNKVMRQLARWYDIKVSYEGKIPERMFGGEMQRDLNLSEVLRLLEKNHVHFTIQDDELIVRP